MKVEEIVDNIFQVYEESPEELARTFLRFQEHYESPEFAGKIFTLEEFEKWYTAASPSGIKTGRFTYYEDWGGFNIPSYIFRPFFRGLFDPLSVREISLLDNFRGIQDKDFYVIGNSGENSKLVLKHEVSHGLFYLNDKYKQEVTKIVNSLSQGEQKPIQDFLLQMGYCEKVLLDETHAFVLTNLKWMEKKGLDITRFSKIQPALEENFQRFTNGKF